MNRSQAGLFLGLCFALMLAGCSDPASLTHNQSAAPVAAGNFSGYQAPKVLSGAYRADTGQALYQSSAAERPATAGKLAAAFASPLFGLTAAPNGGLLIADSPVGAVTISGDPAFELPGITDMAMVGQGAGWAVVGLSGAPGTYTGQSLNLLSNGRVSAVADLFAFEVSNNPDGADVNSNPFDVAAWNARSAYVADAGANVVLHVTNRGAIDVVAILPEEVVSTDNAKTLFGCPSPAPACELPAAIPAQAVATSIAIGPDGFLYIGELKGFPAPTGESNIWRVHPSARNARCGAPGSPCQKVFDGGFTSIIDLAFGPDGRLHVAEMDEASWLGMELGAGVGGSISSCDVVSGSCDVVAAGIPILTAIAFGKDGALWATRNALIPGVADVFEVN